MTETITISSATVSHINNCLNLVEAMNAATLTLWNDIRRALTDLAAGKNMVSVRASVSKNTKSLHRYRYNRDPLSRFFTNRNCLHEMHLRVLARRVSSRVFLLT